MRYWCPQLDAGAGAGVRVESRESRVESRESSVECRESIVEYRVLNVECTAAS